MVRQDWFTITKPLSLPFNNFSPTKRYFFDIHINGLLEKNLEDKRFFGIINTFVYYHNGSKSSIERLYQDHLDKLHDISAEDSRSYQSKTIDYDTYLQKEAWLNRIKNKFERDKRLSIHKDTLRRIDFPVLPNDFHIDEPIF